MPIALYYTIPRYAILRYAMLCYATLSYAMPIALYYVIPCYSMLRYTALCYIMVHFPMLYCAIELYAMQHYDMLYCVMLYMQNQSMVCCSVCTLASLHLLRVSGHRGSVWLSLRSAVDHHRLHLLPSGHHSSAFHHGNG
jgi:hypothetical protein